VFLDTVAEINHTTVTQYIIDFIDKDMKNNQIKGNDLIKLGFKKEIEHASIEPEENGFHYYSFVVGGKCLLISNSNDERKNGEGYTVEFFEREEVKFNDLNQLKQLIEIIRSSLI
jgi:hypothetical protein